MTHLLGALSVVLLVGMVLTRVAMLRTRGVVAMRFGAIDKTDFLIPPFPLLYLYLILASAFDWPTVIHSTLFASTAAAWAGVALCALAVGTMAATLVAFGSSFRVGIDTEHPDKLITGGIFAHTRNPIYVAFALALCGEFLILPHWLLLLYLLAGVTLFHRQVLREEAYLASHYGAAYEAYRRRVRRYL